MLVRLNGTKNSRPIERKNKNKTWNSIRSLGLYHKNKKKVDGNYQFCQNKNVESIKEIKCFNVSVGKIVY